MYNSRLGINQLTFVFSGKVSLQTGRTYHFIITILAMVFISGCVPIQDATLTSATQKPTFAPTITPAPSPIPTADPIEVWIDPDLPTAFHDSLQFRETMVVTDSRDRADFQITWRADGAESIDWVFALAAPFATLIDEVSSQSLRAAWKGEKVEPFSGQPLLMTGETKSALTSIWGEPAVGAVSLVLEDELVDAAWEKRPGWAIVPFEQLTPRLKVIQVDGMSPLDPELEIRQYPLKAVIGVIDAAGNPVAEAEIPFILAGNRVSEHIARVFMTGTTAMVRNMALRMEEEGILYPTEKIASLLRSADLTHISNEVPFYSSCPPAKPLRGGMRFCTRPAYMQVLEAIGADVIELTGNHLLDWGPEAFSETLKLYETGGYLVYGGGWSPDAASKPLKLEINGNKLAFIGCNPSGPEADWATPDRPGSAQCDYDWMEAQIRVLRQQGYLPIVTIQHIEVYDYKPTSAQRVISERMAQAGAALVSGSQSHFPQGFTFVGDTLVHYGLGNTFFDQMDFGSSRGFLDRSIFYEGRLISTELFTIKLEDYAQPRLMTPEERTAMLEKVFAESGW